MGLMQSSAPHVEGELELRDIQLESLKILKDIDTVCRREGITYWLMYGSLIGVVRHQGFIPWDDDLDIAMPRSDYERFLACFDGRFQELEKYTPVKPEIGLRRPFLITRISNPEYKMVGEYGDEVDELGTFIDIYPLDGLADNMSEALDKKIVAHKLMLRYLRACNFDCYNKDINPTKKLAKSILSRMLGKPDKYQEQLNTLCIECPFDSKKYVGLISWAGTPEAGIYERTWFEDTVYMPFEDMNVPVPSGYDPLLRSAFGDYMQLPPKEERVGHHFYSIIRRL